MQDAPRKPGDVILDRYMPDASDEEREVARANLYRLVATLVRFALRELENENQIRANAVMGVESNNTRI